MSGLLEAVVVIVVVWAEVSVLMIALAFVGGYAARLYERLRSSNLDREAAWLGECERIKNEAAVRTATLADANRDLRSQLAALKAVVGNGDDTLDAAFRDALRERDAAVEAAQVEQARRIEAEQRASHWEAVARHHPSAFGVEMAHRVLAADSDPTPPHGTVRPIRGGAE